MFCGKMSRLWDTYERGVLFIDMKMRGRRRQKRRLQFNYRENYFKPAGVPLRQLDETIISDEELEALRLQYLVKLDQREAAKKMGISQSQFQRDITKAIEKISQALIEGNAISVRRYETLNKKK